MRVHKTAAYLLEMQKAGLARSVQDNANLTSISSGRILTRYPDYWCTQTKCECPDKCCRKAQTEQNLKLIEPCFDIQEVASAELFRAHCEGHRAFQYDCIDCGDALVPAKGF